MTGIELFENYFKQGDVFVWHRLISSVPIICEITDMQPGTTQFTVELCKRRNSRYYFSKARRLNPTRFKVIRMFQ